MALNDEINFFENVLIFGCVQWILSKWKMEKKNRLRMGSEKRGKNVR